MKVSNWRTKLKAVFFTEAFTSRLEEFLNALARLQAIATRIKLDALTVYFAARDVRTPILIRLFALGVAAYALSPIDLIPDFIPVLGYLDDIILLPLSIGLIVRLTPREVLADCRIQADRLSERISSTGGALMVAAIWVICAGSLSYWVVNWAAIY